jgi:hypothetical protein
MTNTLKSEINKAIKTAASEITDLWWAKPNENGHVKTAVVEEIIKKHLKTGGAK